VLNSAARTVATPLLHWYGLREIRPMCCRMKSLIHVPFPSSRHSIVSWHVTVDALEQIVRAETEKNSETHPRSPAVACRRFKTPHAVVSFSSRRHHVTDDDILAAMDEVRLRLRK